MDPETTFARTQYFPPNFSHFLAQKHKQNSELLQLFDKLKAEQNGFRKKVLTIEGDCSEPGLGLSPDDRQRIAEHIDVVFHVAATVRFDEKLPVAVAINVAGTRELLLLCNECHKIKVSELSRNL
jgi:fatty acyl-CoA reductase